MIYVHQAVQIHYREERPWVARIDGVDPRFGFRRRFVRPRRDYRKAARGMSGKMAGVKDCFLLESGWICEFYTPGTGRKNPDKRYFARVTDDGLVRMQEEDVIEWLTRKK